MCAVLAAGCDEDGGDDTMGAGTTGTATTTDEPTTDEPTTEAPSSGGGEDEVDEDAVLADAMAYATDMERVTNEALGSRHTVADTVHFYVRPEDRELYLTLDPDGEVEATFPEGTLIVKENLDEAGDPDGFFAMYKAFEGYDPDGNDWYWLRVNGAGAAADSGKVGFCKNCHNAVATSDFLYGVPLDNRL